MPGSIVITFNDPPDDEEYADVSASHAGLRLKQAFLEALQTDFAVHGAEVIAVCRADDPLQYMKLIASLLPKGGDPRGAKAFADDLARLSDQELLVRIRSLEVAIDASISAASPASQAGAGAAGTQTSDRHPSAAVLPPLR